MSIEPREFRNVLGRYPTGVTIITARVDDEGNQSDVGMTMNSFTAVSLDPPLVLFCVDRKSISLPAWTRSAAFGISILSEGQHDLSNKFAKANTDKWTTAPIVRGPKNIALIDGAYAHLGCQPYEQVLAGDHILFIVEVIHIAINSRPGPLVFFEGRYNHVTPGPRIPFDWPLPIHY